jgi:hypothetical protein
MTAPAELMSLRQYAKRRGVSAMAVSDACKDGRLKACVVRDPETNRVKGITDPYLADREWAQNTDVMKAPPKEQAKAASREAAAFPEIGDSLPELAGEELTVANASAQDKYWSAKKRELEYREAAGELVAVSEVESKLVGVFTHCKTKLLAIPSRLKQSLPHLTTGDLAELEKLIRESLEDLAAGAEVDE